MIAILSTDKALLHMLSLEIARAGLAAGEAADATLWLLDLDRPPRPLPQKSTRYVIGFSATKAEDARADTLLPLPYPTEALQALLRRAHHTPEAAADIRYLPHTVLIGEQKIHLSPAEDCIFALLFAKRGEVVTADALRAALPASTADSNVLEVHISRLRRKLTNGGASLIRAVRGVGYRMM